jgi:hypothetical protein
VKVDSVCLGKMTGNNLQIAWVAPEQGSIPVVDKLIVTGLGFSLSAEGKLAIGAAVLIVLIVTLAGRWLWR